MDCSEDTEVDVLCIDSITGEICAIDVDGKLKCGFQAIKTKKTSKEKVIERPTLKISEISHKGQF